MDDWIFDSVVSFMESPQWTSPILTFIDENCGFFEDEEDNQLVYTDIHKVKLRKPKRLEINNRKIEIQNIC